MARYCDALTLLRLHGDGMPLLDVRSPGEFIAGHIPGAVNLPLLSDAEREIVGKSHAHGGGEAAVRTGLTLLGPQLVDKLDAARRLLDASTAPDREWGGREIAVYCWRGGQRSRAYGWLLEIAGYAVKLLRGGYRAYRTHVRASLARSARVLVLGGMTGSGKTAVLHALAARGSQVIDLEGLAGHRGSAFGGVGLVTQGSGEMFENHLEAQWAKLDFRRPIWVEDEDRRIGDLAVSPAFFPHIEQGKLVILRASMTERMRRLTELYAGTGQDEALAAAVMRLEKRLGTETAQYCVRCIRNGDYAAAVCGVLGYYDRAYERQLLRRKPLWAGEFELNGDPAAMAACLAEHEDALAG